MITNAIVRDTTGRTGAEGTESRAALLLRELGGLKIDVSEWKERAQLPPGDRSLLLLAHRNELSAGEEAELKRAAAAGAHVIRYSGGAVKESDDTVGLGRIIDLAWPTVRRAVGMMKTLATPDFARALDAVRRRDLLVAIGIVSWCVSRDSGRRHVAQQQRDWIDGAQKWRDMLAGQTRESVLGACGVDSIEELHSRTPNLAALVRWVWPAPGEQPDVPKFGAIVEDLRQRYTVSI